MRRKEGEGGGRGRGGIEEEGGGRVGIEEEGRENTLISALSNIVTL